MDPTRPSWLTMEGIITVALTVITMLSSVGVLTLTTAHTLEDAVKQIGVIVTMAIPTVISIWKLIQSRTEIKVSAIQAGTEMSQAAVMQAQVDATVTVAREKTMTAIIDNASATGKSVGEVHMAVEGLRQGGDA